ncbi:Ankyrin repeat-containing protein [Spatholobus suberectus]|nr:Ankyrin repeat-containing protein [Spatholobus suberectus]
MEVKATPTLEDDPITTLYEASLNGCVSTLNTLIQRNPLILNRISLSPFGETPLHIASLLGHLEFCEILLKRKPSLASEVDSEGRFPLHLACAEGHTEVVKALLLTNPDVCFALDKDDMLPLHLAAMRGRIGAIQVLTRTKPDSTQQIVDDGSVLHLCARYNHLEALKFLVQSATMNQPFLLAKDREGNTVLHLAVRLKQIKTIKYLLTLPEMRTAANALNKAGLTALEVLERCPRDFISLKIEDMLLEAGIQRSAHNIAAGAGSAHHQGSSPNIATQTESPSHQSKRRKFWETLWFRYLQYRSSWIEEKRGSLMVVATVIATMTFQSAISPPGGVWQEDTLSGGLNCTTYGICKAGTAVLAYDWPHGYLKFMTFNTASFFSSLCVVVLLISGLRLDNKPMMWILIIALFSALISMGHTYFSAQRLVTPDHIVHKVHRMSIPWAIVWVIIPVVVLLFHVLHLVIFCVKKRKKKLLQGSESLPVFIRSD